MDGTLLALNCGSSSVKFALFARHATGPALLKGQVENIGPGLKPRLLPAAETLPAGTDGHDAIVAWLIARRIVPAAAAPIRAVGHRVVHGGTRFACETVVGAKERRAIEELAPLAPAHQFHNLAGIDAARAALPDALQVACFDTAFHRSIPEHRQLMALPAAYAGEGLRRFGFHGLSYRHLARRLPGLLGRRAGGKVVCCHLGNGCSLAAIAGGRSVWTSMGFTPLDGLVMGRRPGRLDAGAVLWLVRRHGGDVDAVDALLNRRAGLLGISGISSDMRDLLADGGAAARLAIAMFVDRLVQEIAAAAAAMEGLDAVVSTGGIGENAAELRARALAGLAWLGFALDPEANAAHAATITAASSPRSAHVVAADEEAEIATATAALLAGRVPA